MTKQTAEQKPADLPAVETSPGPLLEEISTLHHPRRKAEKARAKCVDHRQVSGGVPGNHRGPVALYDAVSPGGQQSRGQFPPRLAALKTQGGGQLRVHAAVDDLDFQTATHGRLVADILKDRSDQGEKEGRIPAKDRGGHRTPNLQGHLTEGIEEGIAKLGRTDDHPEITPGVDLLLLDGWFSHAGKAITDREVRPSKSLR